MGRGRAASIKSIAGGENDDFLTCLGETDKGRVCERWPGRPPGLTPGGFFPGIGTGGSVDEGRGPCACPMCLSALPRRTSTRPPHPPRSTPCPYARGGYGWLTGHP